MRIGVWVRGTVVVGLAVTLVAPARAQDDDKRALIAQMAFLAQLAPKVCTDFTTDIGAVAGMMAAAGFSERDLLGAMAPALHPVADAFQASYKRDPMAACHQVWERLGDDGLGLVVQGDDN